MYPNYIKHLLQIEDVKVKKVYYGIDNTINIMLETKPSQHICPCCGKSTSRVHDYRNQKIKHIPMGMYPTILILRKRRYSCSCGKRFYENYTWLPKYQHMTRQLIKYICHKLRDTVSYKHVAKESNVSISTVIRTFNRINYPKLDTFPEILCIDEFRGNAETDKYQCILVDGRKKHQHVIEILPDRKQHHLTEYFISIPRKEREKVKFFIQDMWLPYKEIANTYFKNAKIIIDKYHFVRQVTWAIDRVRRRLQEKMSAKLRKYFKYSKSLILKRYKYLTKEQKEKCDLMLLYNDELRQAHFLKEWFFDICRETKYRVVREEFSRWIKNAESSGIKDFEDVAATFQRWYKEILNSFKYGYTNGATEGFNNKIKVLKRVSYGIKNFDRFRNRILHICG